MFPVHPGMAWIGRALGLEGKWSDQEAPGRGVQVEVSGQLSSAPHCHGACFTCQMETRLPRAWPVWSGPLLRQGGRGSGTDDVPLPRTLSCWLVVPGVWLQTSALSAHWAHLPLWAGADPSPNVPRLPLAQALAALPPPSSVSIGSWYPVPPAGFGGQSSPWKTASPLSSLLMS